jgi:hypothetical protein
MAGNRHGMWICELFFGTPPVEFSREEIEKYVNDFIEHDAELSSIHQRIHIPIRVKECGEGIRALYHNAKKEIWISPHFTDEWSLLEALRHESIHAADHLVDDINISSLKGLARSEVHAMGLCECRGAWLFRRCVWYRSIEAVSLACGDLEKAISAVDSVFHDCYSDYFGREEEAISHAFPDADVLFRFGPYL